MDIWQNMVHNQVQSLLCLDKNSTSHGNNGHFLITYSLLLLAFQAFNIWTISFIFKYLASSKNDDLLSMRCLASWICTILYHLVSYFHCFSTNPTLDDIGWTAELLPSTIFSWTKGFSTVMSSASLRFSGWACLLNWLFSARDIDTALDDNDGTTSLLLLFVVLPVLVLFSIPWFSGLGCWLDWSKIDVSFMHLDSAFCKSACLFLHGKSIRCWHF